MRRKIIAAFVMAITLLSTTLAVFADTTTGLIGQYEFEGDLKNSVTGESAVVTANKTNVEVTDQKPILSTGIDGYAILFNGEASGYGVELLDCVPESNTFTFSYDVYYTKYTQYSPVLFLQTELNEKEGSTWISFGQTWNSDLSYAPSLWLCDSLKLGKFEWLDVIKEGGVPELIDESGNWRRWTNITYVVDEGKVNIYVNGDEIDAVAWEREVEDDTPLVYPLTKDTRLFMAVNAWNSPVSAAIDNLYIYERALTAEDIKELISERNYNSGAPIQQDMEIETETYPDGKGTEEKNVEEKQENDNEEEGNKVSKTVIIVCIIIVIMIIIEVIAIVNVKKNIKNNDEE